VRVIDIGDLPGNSTVKLHANAVAQTAMAYVRGASGTPTGDR
jgi:hypothetical protein